MDGQSVAGLTLIVGFVLMLIAGFLSPPGLYQEPDSEARLVIIADHPGRWKTSNLFYALAGMVTAAGQVWFAFLAQSSANPLLVGAGAGAFALGSAAWVVFMIQRTVRPDNPFTSYAFSPLTVFLIASLVIGLLLMGIVFLQVGYPRWLGVGTIAGMVFIGGAALFFPAQFFEKFPPQILFFFTLASGFVMLLG